MRRLMVPSGRYHAIEHGVGGVPGARELCGNMRLAERSRGCEQADETAISDGGVAFISNPGLLRMH